MKLILLALLLFATSCSLLSGFNKRKFHYEASNQQSQTLTLLIPRGYVQEKIAIDSAGNKEQVYHYSNGTILYFVQTIDTLKPYQPIIEENSIPLPHPHGGWIYKGIDSNNLYWREIRQGYFRFGYRFVPTNSEIKFDSVLNFISSQRERKEI